MLGRVAVGGAIAAMMLAVVAVPVPSAAKGFAVHSGAHPIVFRAHARGRHRHRGLYPYGYAYLPLGFEYGGYAPQEVVVPAAYPVSVGPRCIRSVETVIVPAEFGGERRIRITRC